MVVNFIKKSERKRLQLQKAKYKQNLYLDDLELVG